MSKDNVMMPRLGFFYSEHHGELLRAVSVARARGLRGPLLLLERLERTAQ
jgi:hypothetical protein